MPVSATEKTTRSRVISVVSNSLTVADVLSFADALREAEVPGREKITCHHNFNTRQLEELSMSMFEELEQ